ncbi:hypothetical protein QZH41_000609 [Actinostola sp. cb2023]|nr:hypothetical protein QZH41_000609 [Actinostola sp. cb2023]
MIYFNFTNGWIDKWDGMNKWDETKHFDAQYLDESVKNDVRQQQSTANEIIKFITNGAAKHQAYNRLAKFTDTFGSRIAGSQNLENAIDYMLNELKNDGLENVHGEQVKVVHWVRGRVKKIPTACITIEDAEMMGRMAARGTKVVITLKMEAKNLPPAMSRNTVAEIVGSKYPEQVVLVSGHLDSWDVGQGAMDDGGGAFISWQALSVIRQLNLRPKRTLRVVLWTGEEEGLLGGLQYYNAHKVNISNYDLVMESDIGTFKPLGLDFKGSVAAHQIMEEVLKLLQPINATRLSAGEVDGDIVGWVNNGVPGGSLANQNDDYFYYHHSDGDTMTVLNADDLDLCAAAWAVIAYTVANMEEMLPR